jgi:hypothetical protein
MNASLGRTAAIYKILLATSLILLLSSCGSGKKSIPGIANFDVGVIQNHLYASFVSTNLNWDAGGTVPIPGLKDATVGISPYLPTDGSPLEGTVFQFSIGLDSLGATNYALAGLPDNRDLPDIQGGKLPRWSFSIKKEPIYLYLADEAFAIFVPLKLQTSAGVSLNVMVSATIQDERGNRVGKIYAIPSVANGNISGLLVMLPFPGHSGTSSTPGIIK